MEKEIIKKYNKSKSISDSTVLYIKPMLKEGVGIVEIGEKIENKIKELGGGIAFPVNISINENAAHYTPDIRDSTKLNEGDLVKIDIGTHVDGYIWDRAFTVCIGKNSHPLIDASKEALEKAKKLIKPGTEICEISEVVEDTLSEHGFNPIRNLCGHGLDRYKPHSRFSIPNGKNNIKDELESDQALAMEVFATDGVGWVKDSQPTLIFAYKEDKAVRMKEARKILDAAKNDFHSLPFAKRWIPKLGVPELKVNMAIDQLLQSGAIKEYPILKEDSNGLVAQHEETFLI